MTNPAPILIGNLRTEAGLEPLPVSGAEMQRTQMAVERVLASFSVERERLVLLISLLEDSAFAIPIERAVMSLGLLITNADTSPYEAARIESILRRFDVAAVIGVSKVTLDGLAAAGHSPADLFSGRIVWAYDEALEPLRDVPGITLRRMREIGPALAMECVDGSGLHVDSGEWLVEMEGGEVLLTSRLARSTPFRRYRTGVSGSLSDAPCACGNADLKIVL